MTFKTEFEIPIEPKPQTRPKFSKFGTYEDPKMKRWRKEVSGWIEKNYDGPFFDDCIKVEVIFYMKAPKTLSKEPTQSSKDKTIQIYQNFVRELIWHVKKPDIENKNNHFINLNLADYSRLFGDTKLFDEFDKLPKPDLIIASPPCESWSVASAMDRGNACWKQERGDGLFEPQIPLSKFTVRDFTDYDRYQFKPDKSFLKRINGGTNSF